MNPPEATPSTAAARDEAATYIEPVAPPMRRLRGLHLRPCPTCALAIVYDEHGAPATQHIGSAICQAVAAEGPGALDK